MRCARRIGVSVFDEVRCNTCFFPGGSLIVCLVGPPDIAEPCAVDRRVHTTRVTGKNCETRGVSRFFLRGTRESSGGCLFSVVVRRAESLRVAAPLIILFITHEPYFQTALTCD